MKTPFQITMLIVVLASCGGTSGSSVGQIDEVHFSSTVSFARTGYELQFPVSTHEGQKVLDVACYSLDDASREDFASATGSDPVADLSCYVKDLSRTQEYTMLGLDGESLQFTPAFFWFNDVEKCAPSSYLFRASLRGLSVSFNFSQIDVEEKTAELSIDIAPLPSAINDRLTEQSFEINCTSRQSPD